MSRKQRPRGLRAALVSYDERQLRVWSRYLEEQSAGLVCRCCQSGEELLTLLRQGEQIDVVVLGGTLADMDELAFVEQISRLHAKPFLLLPDDGRHRAGAGASLGPGNACYLIRQTSLRDLLRRLQELPNDPEERIVQFCGECYDRWGVAQPDVNCTYLTQAVCVACGSEAKLAIRKEILQPVAERHETTIAAIDSGLRRLIECLEVRRSVGWLAFKRDANLSGVRVSTGKLIYALKGALERSEKLDSRLS